MTLVAGVDSSTQSCKVVVRDAATGALLRRGSAPHPPGTEVDPEAWWDALGLALAEAGGLVDVAALSIGGQQHGLVCLDEDGRVIRPAILWNDTRSAGAAHDLVVELGDGDAVLGARRWAQAIGTVPVASLTVTKLRWLADHEPENAARIAAVLLPHDWLTWRLSGSTSLEEIVTDRSEASGTGYFDSVTDTYRLDLLALALRRTEGDVKSILLPRVLRPSQEAGRGDAALGFGDVRLGPGCGDNAGAALGLALVAGQCTVSLGTSGVVATVSDIPTTDATGIVAGFADATGRYLPLAATLNGARVLDATARVLGVDHDELSRLALSADSGAGGLVQVPYLEGERTPNLPTARGELQGMSLSSFTRENLARVAVEGLLGLLGNAINEMRARGVVVERVSLLGGGARSEAVRVLAPAVWGVPVDVLEPADDVANGAARQAAWVLSGSSEPPHWDQRPHDCFEAEPTPAVQTAFDLAAGLVADRLIPVPVKGPGT